MKFEVVRLSTGRISIPKKYAAKAFGDVDAPSPDTVIHENVGPLSRLAGIPHVG
jgi:hypothetical protein